MLSLSLSLSSSCSGCAISMFIIKPTINTFNNTLYMRTTTRTTRTYAHTRNTRRTQTLCHTCRCTSTQQQQQKTSRTRAKSARASSMNQRTRRSSNRAAPPPTAMWMRNARAIAYTLPALLYTMQKRKAYENVHIKVRAMRTQLMERTAARKARSRLSGAPSASCGYQQI